MSIMKFCIQVFYKSGQQTYLKTMLLMFLTDCTLEVHTAIIIAGCNTAVTVEIKEWMQ